MTSLGADAPCFSQDDFSTLAARHHGLTGALTPLVSERDQNMLLRTQDGRAWVLKIANANEDPALIDAQIAALRHIQAVDATLPVPEVRPTTDGADSVLITAPDGRRHRFYAVSYLEGEIAGSCDLGPADYRRIGAGIARLGRALRGFTSPALIGRRLVWDLREAGAALAKADCLPAGAPRAEVAACLDHVVREVLPRLARLRAQTIHGDVHEHNLILGTGNAIAGFIDFGDMIHAPLVFDIASALGDFITRPEGAAGIMSALVEGYNSVTPLEEEELEVLYDLMLARQATTMVILAYRIAANPDNPPYLAAHGFGAPEAFRALHAMGRGAATALFRRACGLSGSATPAPVAELLERRKRVMGSRPYVFYDPPLHMVKGEGVWLIDATGRRYLDCYNNVPIVGHCHPRVIGAIDRQMRVLNTNTRYLGEQVLDYAERLGALTGGELTACAFVNSGSEANDIAWRMARAWTGNRGFLCQDFAYHGITEAIEAVSPSAIRRGQSPDHVRTVLAPDGYRGPYRHGTPDLGARYAADADRAIASLAEAGLKPATVIVDSAFMTNGILAPVPGYVGALFDKVRAAGGLCIADEVQAGFGRMGEHFWGYQHHGVTPDFVTIGKPAGNGHPLGVVLTRPEILDHFCEQTAFFSTFGGNNVSAAAGLAVLDVIADGDHVRRAGETARSLFAGLQALKARHPIIGDVRSAGLAFGVELVRDRADLTPAPEETERLINLMREEGLLVGSEGVHGNIVKMRPPLIFEAEHADLALEMMDRALARL
ncbi:aminotransferase class III-fold pyridoxal phosphate-dependent enzyme [Albidovulum sediminicola]|uniref:Aminotransferase class III-fold pyridoxal phosphate-dependent enzyme n=1 Tax=Albidovulum sediminicola TaxID=2984331 RepID=A0ABT2YXS5_9RHOB|nr:aminotransferase class III-fold pyridoxal phosphate-dependent enzyme [Defluviimonas sp. WL0075]MCV2863684.1 aminotransferase class III-fold pyridoxal phosphate-dependent enzyme [Defluviimonas sp. WL0075]